MLIRPNVLLASFAQSGAGGFHSTCFIGGCQMGRTEFILTKVWHGLSILLPLLPSALPVVLWEISALLLAKCHWCWQQGVGDQGGFPFLPSWAAGSTFTFPGRLNPQQGCVLDLGTASYTPEGKSAMKRNPVTNLYGVNRPSQDVSCSEQDSPIAPWWQELVSKLK